MRAVVSGGQVKHVNENHPEIAATPSREEQEANRQAAFAREADPLYFKWQAGEATEAEWIAAREAIRARYPYPE